MFFELDGLFDLEQVLTRHYSPNRGTVAIQRFERMVDALREGRYGQPGFTVESGALDLRSTFDRFCSLSPSMAWRSRAQEQRSLPECNDS